MIISVAYMNATYAAAKIMPEKKYPGMKAIPCKVPSLKAQSLFLQPFLLLDAPITTKIFHAVENSLLKGIRPDVRLLSTLVGFRKLRNFQEPVPKGILTKKNSFVPKLMFVFNCFSDLKSIILCLF